MYRSVFAKYITAFMLIIIVSFTILAAIISTTILNNSTESTQKNADRASENVKKYIENNYSDTDPEDFVVNITDVSNNIQRNISTLPMFATELFASDSLIFITDRHGNILFTSKQTDDTLLANIVPNGVFNELVMQKILQSSGTLGDLFENEYITSAKTIYIRDELVGSVFVCSSAENLNKLVELMVKTIIMASLWVLLAALIAVYFITEKIIGPLKDMGKAAKSFASGKFDVRVPVIGHDEVAELAQAFNNMANSLASLEDMRRTFLANVSHDLRTPMTTIGMTIDNIIAGAIPEEKHQYYLEFIGSEVLRLSRLITSLLDITRIQAGDRKFTMEPFDICEMARMILFSFEQKIDAKRLDVEFDIDNDNMMVIADRDAVYQILYNICDNAVKFSKEEGKYKISLHAKDKKVFVAVYNEGAGIPKDDLPYVFDRFYKADKSRGLDKTGTGLGLFIAKTIIDAHGEDIWVRSEENRFCEFIFTLKQK